MSEIESDDEENLWVFPVYGDVPSSVRCKDCREEVYGHEIRHLTIPPMQNTRLIRTVMTFHDESDGLYFLLSTPARLVDQWRYRDLRTTSLADLDASTMLVWDRWNGGLCDMRSSIPIDNWDVIAQDLAPHRGKFWQYPDPNRNPSMVPERTPVPATYKDPDPDWVRDGVGKSLDFDLNRKVTAEGSSIWVRRPNRAGWKPSFCTRDEPFNRCPNFLLRRFDWNIPGIKWNARVHKRHEASAEIQHMRYGLSKAPTPWVHVSVELHVDVQKDGSTFLVKSVDPYPKVSAWRALEPNSPASQNWGKLSFTLFGRRDLSDTTAALNATFSGMPVIGTGDIRHPLNVMGGRGSGFVIYRFVRRIWCDIDNRFKLEFVRREDKY